MARPLRGTRGFPRRQATFSPLIVVLRPDRRGRFSASLPLVPAALFIVNRFRFVLTESSQVVLARNSHEYGSYLIP
jgi:hypothetical protein